MGVITRKVLFASGCAASRLRPMAKRPPALAEALRVPFLDLGPMHAPIRASILTEIVELVDSGAFTNGPQVAAFEEAFARYCGTGTCVGVASGLDALRLALLAAGLQPGDEVIVPANTFVATLEAVTQAGGRPVVVDATESDYNLDIAAVEAALNARTRAVVPVHLYGQLADMRALKAVAARHDLVLVEDACQAHGAARDGLVAGTAGLAGAFSFYPGKNLGAFGDAGALTTTDAALAERVRALREHGQRTKYVHDVEGYTARLDTIQAIVLCHKLAWLDRWNEQRRAAAVYYDEQLAGIGDIGLPPVPAGSKPVWHLYEARTTRADALVESLAQRGISTGRHYPVPAHLAPAYAHLGYPKGAFPVAEGLARELVSLPIFPGISEEQQAAVVAAIQGFFARGV
jgi:dTDP-4-amino-4,6-dideoxygalactose transaminase